MPPVVVGAALTTGMGYALGTVAASALLSTFAANVALGLVAQALAPKPPALESRDNTQSIREAITSRKIIYGRTRVGGSIVYIESTGDENEYLHLVIAVAGHEIDGFEKVYFDDEVVYDAGQYQGGWGSFARINFADGSQTTADSDLVSESAHWTSDHVLNDIAYLYVRLKFDQDKFANGIPNISTVIRGKKIYDPRTETTAWSDNPVLCVRDYLTDSKYGMDVATTELNTASFNSGANICDETVLTTSGSQSRFELHGVVDTASSRRGVIESLLSSCAGILTYSGGEFFIFPSSYRTPTITLDEAVISGGITIQTKQSRRELFNAVKGVFSSIEDNYILTDYPAIVSSSYATEDGGALYLDVDLPYTTNALMAERIAKLSLLRSRQQISATIPCNLSALRLKAGDNVLINNTRLGWSNKVFEITSLRIQAGNDGTLGVELNVIETSSAVYDWTTDDEIDFVAGQPTTLPSATSVNAPTIDSTTAGTITQEDGTTRSYLDVLWTNNDAFTVNYEVQYKTGSDPYESIITKNTNYRIYDVTPDESYTLRIRAINTLGARSSFDTDTSVAIGDPDAPSLPSNFAVDTDLTSFILTWDNPTDADFLYVEILRSSDNDINNAVAIGRTYGTIFADHNFADGATRYYWIRSYDRSGNASSVTAAQSATISYDPRSPRQAYGYVYYTVSTATQPTTPAATSYDFANDTFTGLTTNWQRDPLTIDGVDGDYWASRYIIQEATFGGSQTVSFSTPFQSIQFDGLVTFTNLNTELANPSSTEITTIDGGLIKTGTVLADRIDVLGSANIGNATITTAKIDNGAITTAKIDDAAITNAKIGSLAVDTLNIQNFAVTVPAAVSATGIQASQGGYVFACSLTHDSRGSDVLIHVTSSTNDNIAIVSYQVYRNGTLVASQGSTSGAAQFLVSAPSGTVTYSLYCAWSASQANRTAQMSIVGYRKQI